MISQRAIEIKINRRIYRLEKVELPSMKGQENLQMIPVARPPWTALGKRLESQCRKAIFEFKLLEGVEKLGVALSGGKDSLTLLFLLHAMRGRGMGHFDLFALHVDGEFSCGANVSRSYLERICGALELPLVVRESTQRLEGLNCYSCSRERRGLLFAAAKELGATTVAFGHHRDDNAQTLVMNLLHKAEFASMLPKVPMIDYGVTIIRPLIYCKESDIKTFAQQQGFARLSCQCPVGQKSLRKESEALLQQMEKLYPHARDNITAASFTYGSDKAMRR